MSEADHADLSRRLALAIGWPESAIIDYPGQEYVGIKTRAPNGSPCVRLFCYRWPAVIWPIAEWFDRFPQKNSGTHWFVTVGIKFFYGDTASEAVARAVISKPM